VANLPLKSDKLVVIVAWIFFIAVAFLGFRHCVQQPNGKPFGCQKICDRLKFLWALPTPTTFKKVDQTFNFGTESFSFA
jgi:hypothetical protein